ncbi:MAG: gliding motility-associated C-terminal domain-containing protein [Cytophagaceae bacterium]
MRNIKIQENYNFEGIRRLRIRCRTGSPFNPEDCCPKENEIGETEDYAITLKTPQPLLAPEFISPNDDGYNDYFYIKGLNPQINNHLVIIDKFGTEQYRAQN